MPLNICQNKIKLDITDDKDDILFFITYLNNKETFFDDFQHFKTIIKLKTDRGQIEQAEEDINNLVSEYDYIYNGYLEHKEMVRSVEFAMKFYPYYSKKIIDSLSHLSQDDKNHLAYIMYCINKKMSEDNVKIDKFSYFYLIKMWIKYEVPAMIKDIIDKINIFKKR